MVQFEESIRHRRSVIFLDNFQVKEYFYADMPKSLLERIKYLFSPTEMVPLILETLSHQEIVRCLAAAGVVYPGVRMESIEPGELALGWAEDVLRDPESLSVLVRAMDNAHDKDIQVIRTSSITDIERMMVSLPETFRQRKPVGLIWALARDERDETLEQAARLLEAFYRFLGKQFRKLDKFDRLSDHLWHGRLTKKETEEVKRTVIRLMQEKKKSDKLIEQQAKDKDNLAHRMDTYKQQAAQREQEVYALKNDLAALRRELARKDALICELEHRTKIMSRQEEDALRRQAHELEREGRKMAHEIGVLNGQMASLQLMTRHKDEECLRLKQELQARQREEEQDGPRTVQVPAQAMEAARSAAAVEKQAQSFKNKGRRLGVFVDTRGLRQACKYLQRKADFQKLLDFIVLGRHLVKAIAYVTVFPEMDSTGFVNMLQERGFQVRTRNFIRFADGSVQAGWGAVMATDMIQMAQKMGLDIVHVVGAEVDLVEAIRLLKAQGVHTEASGFEVNTALELRQAADEFIVLGDEVLKPALA